MKNIILILLVILVFSCNKEDDMNPSSSCITYQELYDFSLSFDGTINGKNYSLNKKQDAESLNYENWTNHEGHCGSGGGSIIYNTSEPNINFKIGFKWLTNENDCERNPLSLYDIFSSREFNYTLQESKDFVSMIASDLKDGTELIDYFDEIEILSIDDFCVDEYRLIGSEREIIGFTNCLHIDAKISNTNNTADITFIVKSDVYYF